MNTSLKEDLQYITASLVIAKTPLNGYFNQKGVTGSILVHAQRIISIGYDNSKTGETAELMALAQVGYSAPGAFLYTSLVPSPDIFYAQLPRLVNSQISRLIYGYYRPVGDTLEGSGEYAHRQKIFRKLEQAGIRLIYLRIPEVLRFYAPYRFADVIRGC